MRGPWAAFVFIGKGVLLLFGLLLILGGGSCVLGGGFFDAPAVLGMVTLALGGGLLWLVFGRTPAVDRRGRAGEAASPPIMDVEARRRPAPTDEGKHE